jgi:hypothetical protein
VNVLNQLQKSKLRSVGQYTDEEYFVASHHQGNSV